MKLIIRILVLNLCFSSLVFGFNRICIAQVPEAAEVQRSEVLLDKEAALNNKLTAEKNYIKEIIVQGASLIPAEKIKAIVSPFQKHLLAKNDIEQVVGLIRQAYQEKALLKQPEEITYEIKEEQLIINIKE